MKRKVAIDKGEHTESHQSDCEQNAADSEVTHARILKECEREIDESSEHSLRERLCCAIAPSA